MKWFQAAAARSKGALRSSKCKARYRSRLSFALA